MIALLIGYESVDRLIHPTPIAFTRAGATSIITTIRTTTTRTTISYSPPAMSVISPPSHPPPGAADDTEQVNLILLLGHQHEIGDRYGAIGCLKPGFEDAGLAAITARGLDDGIRWGDQPTPVLGFAEQCSEDGLGVKTRQAQPIDRPVAPDERRGAGITDDAVVFDRGTHGCFGPPEVWRLAPI